MEELTTRLKQEIVAQLNLDHVKAEDIGNDDPLFGDGLGLDSIDALELIVLVNEKHGITIPNPEEGVKIFQSVRTIAEFIQANKQ
jgi:acyl carrier protein